MPEIYFPGWVGDGWWVGGKDVSVEVEVEVEAELGNRPLLRYLSNWHKKISEILLFLKKNGFASQQGALTFK